jgi:hypothetical protein
VAVASLLATENLVFIGVHVKYREIESIVMVCVLGLLMAFIAYGRMVLKPIVSSLLANTLDLIGESVDSVRSWLPPSSGPRASSKSRQTVTGANLS